MAVGDRERFWLRLNLRRVDREAVRRRCHRVLFERLLPLLAVWVTGVAVAVCGLLLAPILPTVEDVMRFVSGSVLGGGTLVIIGMVASRTIGFLRGAVAGPTAKLVKEPDLLGGGHRLLSAQLNGSFDKLVPDPGYASRLGFLHLVQTDMKRVLDLVATPQRPLIVFVNSVPRAPCRPGRPQGRALRRPGRSTARPPRTLRSAPGRTANEPIGTEPAGAGARQAATGPGRRQSRSSTRHAVAIRSRTHPHDRGPRAAGPGDT